MAKNKKNIKVRDLKPSKDAKGGGPVHAEGKGSLGAGSLGSGSLGTGAAGSGSLGKGALGAGGN
jgi:hypothetical protein